MKPLLKSIFLVILPFTVNGLTQAQEAEPAADEEVFEYNVGEVNYLTGEGFDIGGFIFPELFLNATGGLLEPGTAATDLATTEHDPQNEVGIQIIEVHLDINFQDVITGAVYGAGFQGEDEWEANLEEAYLHYHLNDWIAIGGGQFLNAFGFQAEKHVHQWEFINQNLINSRMLNEGELITQGGEAIIQLPNDSGELTIGGGGVRTHAHDHGHDEEDEHGHEDEDDHEIGHGHEEEEEHGHHDEEEEHHLEADDANFRSWVASADASFILPFDETATVSASVATGENGFGRQTWAYGAGVEKIWGAHDHGNGPEFCLGAVMLRTEFIGRHIGIEDDEGDRFNANDYGFSTALFYGLTDTTTVSIRHDWVSDLYELELEDRHRISPAVTTFLDKGQRVQARLQYDYNHSDSFGSEHAAWLQFQIQWGGHGGHHHHH
ncbi:MAG: hypothetical protein HKN23_14150 [Verrucomicrobiales bacterium]|nr:hypothetical protein [Verrucomicrobiales bacterium]